MYKNAFESNSLQLHFKVSREFINSKRAYWYRLLDINEAPQRGPESRHHAKYFL